MYDYRTGLCALAALAFAGVATASDDPYRWETPSGAIQLHGDRGTIPADMGAVFVPTLSAQGDEPDIYLVNGDRVYRGPTGQRVAVPPGRYVVLVGSANPKVSAGRSVDVAVGKTTLVPVNWGGLRLDIVDHKMRPANAALELLHVQTNTMIRLPLELGAEPGTRLLKPGLYRIQEPGASSDSEPAFTTVHVPVGGLVHQRVFVDNAGRVIGGGVIDADSATKPIDAAGPKGWRRSLVLGADGSYAHNQAVPGTPDFRLATGSVLLNGEASHLHEAGLVELHGTLDEGVMYLQPSTGKPLPLIKSSDKAQLDARYTLLFNDGVGFYVGGSAQTKLFDTLAVTGEDITVRVDNRNGPDETLNVGAGETYQVAKAFAPTLLSAGTGLRLRFATHPNLELAIRGGPAIRVYNFGGSWMPLDDPDTDAVEYVAPSDIRDVGLEAGASTVIRINRLVTYRGDISIFDAFDDLNARDRLIIAWDNDLSLALTSNLSIHYRARVDQIREISRTPSLSQSVSLRAAWNLL